MCTPYHLGDPARAAASEDHRPFALHIIISEQRSGLSASGVFLD